MKFAYTIIYVPSVADSLTFFENAFGFTRRFLHESGDYGELDTGETTLAFAAIGLGNINLPNGFVAASASPLPLGIEIAFTTESIQSDHSRAISAGAAEIKPPEAKPWGQSVSYLRCPDGTLVELCTPMTSA
jgi:lactoylglutathione lyase